MSKVVAVISRLLSKVLGISEKKIEDQLNRNLSDVKTIYSQNCWMSILLIIVQIVVVYYYEKGTLLTTVLEFMATIRFDFGFLYSILSTVIFLGVIPWFIYLLSNKIPMDKKLMSFLFMCITAGVIGVEYDIFYKFQSDVVGDFSFLIVVIKVFIDQCLFTPLIMSHQFYWRNWVIVNGMKFPKFSKQSLYQYLSQEWIIAALGGYVIWIPSCITIYAFHEDIQIIMFDFICCLVLILLNVTTVDKSRSSNQNNHENDEKVFEIEDSDLMDIKTHDIIDNHDE